MANYKLLYNQYHFKLKRLVVVSNRRIKIWNRKKENKLIHHLAYTTKPREKNDHIESRMKNQFVRMKYPRLFRRGYGYFLKDIAF